MNEFVTRRTQCYFSHALAPGTCSTDLQLTVTKSDGASSSRHDPFPIVFYGFVDFVIDKVKRNIGVENVLVESQ